VPQQNKIFRLADEVYLGIAAIQQTSSFRFICQARNSFEYCAKQIHTKTQLPSLAEVISLRGCRQLQGRVLEHVRNSSDMACHIHMFIKISLAQMTMPGQLLLGFSFLKVQKYDTFIINKMTFHIVKWRMNSNIVYYLYGVSQNSYILYSVITFSMVSKKILACFGANVSDGLRRID